jgi:hypothetical protein
VTAGEETVIRFFLVDKAGLPVVPERVQFFAYRPSDATRDFEAEMIQEDKGRYMARVRFPLLGIWDTLIAVTSGEEEYSLGQRINVLRP